MIPHDYHLHSNFSWDCKATLAEQCQSAVDKGIPEIGFTEHYDLHPGESCPDWFKLEPWAAELERCRAEFDGKLIIRAGIEIGEGHIYQAETRAMLQRYPFDYVLGSLHWVGTETFFDPKYFRRPADEAYGLFFAELERLTRLGDFDILGHFDVPIRVGLDVYDGYDPSRYENVIRAVLKNCIDRGIALDLNTKCLRIERYAAKWPPELLLTPGLDILRWYAEMGGERVTLGSDAHQAKFIGADCDKAIEIAKRAGLKYLTQFERRQATLLPLDIG